MEVRAYAPAMADAWNAFNAEARNGHMLFDRGFMDYHADRFADASLVAVEDGRVRGLLPANRDGAAIWSHQGLTFGGLVVSDAGAVEIARMLDLSAAAWREAGAASLTYKALPPIYHRRPAQDDLHWLFRRGASLVRRDLTTAIDRREPGAMSKRRTRGAGKARAAGLSFGASDRWDDFWVVLSAVLAERHGAAPAHSAAEIRLLAARFPEAITLHTAQRGEAIMAGVVLFRTPQVCHAQYIAAGEEGRANGALDGLFAHLIAENRSAWFDFGHSTVDQGHTLNEGLVRQKEEFGGSGVAHDAYRLEL